jgi:hypothetical protein
MEEWRDIEGYEDLYKVSDLGRIKSFKKDSNGKILKPREDKDGYLLLNLWKDSKRKTFKIHRLVAQAYIINPENLPQVNHKDGNKQNNFSKNLEWCSNYYNQKHARENNLNNICWQKGENHIGHKLTQEKVLAIRNHKDKNRGYCQRIAKEFNVAPATVSLIQNNIIWKHI